MGDNIIIYLYLVFAFFFLWLQYMFEICKTDAFALTILLMCMIYHGYLGLINLIDELIDERISHHLKHKLVRADIDDESTSSYLRSRRDASGSILVVSSESSPAFL